MRIAGERLVHVPAERVWAFLVALEQSVPCIPGCRDVQVQDSNHARCILHMELGPVRSDLETKVTLTSLVPAERVEGVVEGQDAAIGSAFKAKGLVQLEALSEQETKVRYELDVNVWGRMPPMGWFVAKWKSEEMAKAFADNVITALTRKWSMVDG